MSGTATQHDRYGSRPAPCSCHTLTPPNNLHSMCTIPKSGFLVPQQKLNLSSTVSTISPIPSYYRYSLKDPNWYNAMLYEYRTLMQNNTWTLFACLTGVNVVTRKWIFFCHKFNLDGSLESYKACWVDHGFSQ